MSSDAPSVLPTNALISILPSGVRQHLLGCCETVDLVADRVLCEPGRRYRWAYFPTTAQVSLLAPVDLHPALEMGLIGDEGMLGATLVLGMSNAPLRAVVQGGGHALRISAVNLRREIQASRSLRATLGRYLYVLTVQLAQSAVCTRFHEVEARLARWLLMTHDRAHADHFHLTHQTLADMLGVQRSAVTIAAGNLQRRKLIGYRRGRIDIISRPGLEAASCECYAATVGIYAQSFSERQAMSR
ncbi:MAG: Crp/Fnr family transcriptional regulator [Xanthomonadaceae bacterium]|nr:Crp/Fnr family transcriptional regulator [Xanthomonadaceae bacterium]